MYVLRRVGSQPWLEAPAHVRSEVTRRMSRNASELQEQEGNGLIRQRLRRSRARRPVLGSDLPQMRMIGDGKECKAHLGVPHLYQEYVHGTVDLTDATREMRKAYGVREGESINDHIRRTTTGEEQGILRTGPNSSAISRRSDHLTLSSACAVDGCNRVTAAWYNVCRYTDRNLDLRAK